jgi:lysophospholipase L1-like esterase
MPSRQEKTDKGGSSPRWPLRVFLLVLVLALIAASAMLVTMRPVQLATPTPSSIPATTEPAPSTTVATPTITTISGAFSGSTRVTPVGRGCDLALGSTTMTVSSRAVGRCTVLEIGDSLGEDLSLGLKAVLAPSSGLNLVMLDKVSTGLANSWYYDWPVHLAADLTKYHPQLVVVMLGGNDEQGMVVNGCAVACGSSAWKEAYLADVREIVTEATAAGAYVLWIGLPIMQPVTYNQGAALLNSLYKLGVTTEADATFVPTWSLFSNPQGQFESAAAVNGVETTLRASDGIHFSPAGWDVLATYVIREMALVYHVKLVPTVPAVITHWG